MELEALLGFGIIYNIFKKETMMPTGYVIVQLKVTNPENFKEHVALGN